MILMIRVWNMFNRVVSKGHPRNTFQSVFSGYFRKEVRVVVHGKSYDS